MSRNKYPEETVKQILDVSLRLFMERGYEHTSIQNIIDELGGLTKGAIYHHFKSKEDIMLAVIDRLYENYDEGWLNRLLGKKDMSGLEKLRDMLRFSLNSPKQLEMFRTAPDMLNNPKILTMQIKSIMEDSAPHLVRPFIEQGIADGSIRTDYPGELAEVILLLINLWLSPLVSYAEPETMLRRFRLFQRLLLGIGVDLLDDQMLERFMEFCHIYGEKR